MLRMHFPQEVSSRLHPNRNQHFHEATTGLSSLGKPVKYVRHVVNEIVVVAS